MTETEHQHICHHIVNVKEKGKGKEKEKEKGKQHQKQACLQELKKQIVCKKNLKKRKLI